MAKSDFKSVDEYIALQPEATQAVLQSVRCAIRKSLPAAEEAISYAIPAFKLNGSPILWFAGWKRHYSLYPAGDRLRAAFKDELAPYAVEKSTIRFPLSEPVPIELIEKIAAFRMREVSEKAGATPAAKKKRPARPAKRPADKSS